MVEYAPVQIGVDPPLSGTNLGAIVGTGPLDSKDGDAAYVETQRAAVTGTSWLIPFRLPAGATAAPTARVWLSVESRKVDGNGGVTLLADPPGGFALGVLGGGISLTAGTEYATYTRELDFSTLPSYAQPDGLISPSTVFYLSGSTPVGEASSIRTTWLRIIVVGGAPKVRQIHRDDGRGMTPPRHFGGASRATTGRHFGYD